jgi:hypothetical protein
MISLILFITFAFSRHLAKSNSLIFQTLFQNEIYLPIFSPGIPEVSFTPVTAMFAKGLNTKSQYTSRNGGNNHSRTWWEF